MPEYIDPDWEYRVEDPEIEYCVYGRFPKGYEAFGVDWGKAANTGVRFGRGSPDRHTPGVSDAPDFYDRERAGANPRPPSVKVRCHGCLGEYHPRADRLFCSPKCRRAGPGTNNDLLFLTGRCGLTVKEAAARVGVKYKTAYATLSRAGMRFPRPARTFRCPACSREFRRPGRKRTYCSYRCARFGQHHRRGNP